MVKDHLDSENKTRCHHFMDYSLQIAARCSSMGARCSSVSTDTVNKRPLAALKKSKRLLHGLAVSRFPL